MTENLVAQIKSDVIQAKIDHMDAGQLQTIAKRALHTVGVPAAGKLTNERLTALLEGLDNNAVRIVYEEIIASYRQTFDEAVAVPHSSKTFGSIYLTKYEVTQRTELPAADSSGDVAVIDSGEFCWVIDFLPLGTIEPDEVFLVQSLFLGAVDLQSFIKANLATAVDKPKVILGYTNARMARFIIERAPFHPVHGNLLSNEGQTLVTGLELLTLITITASGKGSIERGIVKDVLLFAHSEEVISKRTLDSLTATVNLVSRYFSRTRDDSTPSAEDLQHLEKEIRIQAICKIVFPSKRPKTETS